jgi:predicted deacylase
LVNFETALARYRACADLAEVTEYGSVLEGGRTYPLIRLTTPGERMLVVTSGFHGEEPAGPITLALHLPALMTEARRRGVGLRIYPCINPSGFEARTRYNQSGERPNNDFLRYELTPGVWRGELRPGETFLRHAPFDGGPKETRALQAELKRWPAPAAALDIHQDRYVPGRLTYAYTFGGKSAYRPMMRAASAYAPVATNATVDEFAYSDADGLIELHDGSVTDYFHQLGVPYVACLETTTHTPLEACDEINLIWLRGFIDLAAR